jgi:hypothetical protein
MMSNTPASTNTSNAPSTESAKRPRNSNWGGQRAGSGRKRMKLPTTTSSSNDASQPAPSHTQHADQPNTASTSLPLTAPTNGFFAPRVPSNPTALHTGGYMGPDVPRDSERLLSSAPGQNGTEFNDSGSVLHSGQSISSFGQM